MSCASAGCASVRSASSRCASTCTLNDKCPFKQCKQGRLLKNRFHVHYQYFIEIKLNCCNTARSSQPTVHNPKAVSQQAVSPQSLSHTLRKKYKDITQISLNFLCRLCFLSLPFISLIELQKGAELFSPFHFNFFFY